MLWNLGCSYSLAPGVWVPFSLFQTALTFDSLRLRDGSGRLGLKVLFQCLVTVLVVLVCILKISQTGYRCLDMRIEEQGLGH